MARNRKRLCYEVSSILGKHLEVLAITNKMSNQEIIEVAAVFGAAIAIPSLRPQFEVAQRRAFALMDEDVRTH